MLEASTISLIPFHHQRTSKGIARYRQAKLRSSLVCSTKYPFSISVRNSRDPEHYQCKPEEPQLWALRSTWEAVLVLYGALHCCNRTMQVPSQFFFCMHHLQLVPPHLSTPFKLFCKQNIFFIKLDTTLVKSLNEPEFAKFTEYLGELMQQVCCCVLQLASTTFPYKGWMQLLC